ncbi:MAG: 2-oxo acid dehydrogenase subunit E2 [Cyclobacteriaceae bacterium]|nr:2-oxo acid dehydrogenase subunit E2 [Cyclobacteriaceae bacterium]
MTEVLTPTLEFRMPSLGADMEAGFLREWKVKPGDHVNRGDIIAEVETQKGIIDIEVFDDGVIEKLLIKVDDKVPVGTAMALISPTGEVTKKESAPVPRAEEAPKPVVVPPEHHLRASPLSRKLAQEKGIDLNKVKGTGPDGAITKADVERAIQEQVAPAVEIKVMPAEAIRAAVAAAMSKSNREIPHYYLETRVDMSKALAWLSYENKERAVKDRLLPAVLYLRAVAKALRVVPELNSYWVDRLQPKQDIHIGFVVSLRTGGIMVPAIHDTDKKSADELMRALTDVILRSRAMRLRSSELSDSTITITSLGDEGAEVVYGVIYPPQVALVGFGKVVEQPWAMQGLLGVRPVLTVTLAADHRATDGGTGSRFLAAVKEFLEKPESLWEKTK